MKELTLQFFHQDISPFLYFADSPLKNYEYQKHATELLGIMIFSGNVESGMNIYSDEEPSAIYTQFKVIKPPFWIKVSPVPYYPRYRALNPYQRYEYLQFLKNPYQKTKTGYLYLLLYCLERRLSEDRIDVIPIMKKLADFHGGKFKHSVNESIRKYLIYKAGRLQPTNTRVFSNYTLYFGCFDDELK